MRKNKFWIFALTVFAVCGNSYYLLSGRESEVISPSEEGRLSGAGIFAYYYCQSRANTCGTSEIQEGANCSVSDAG